MSLMVKGNRYAFERLYEQYFNRLVWFARGFVKEEEQVRDLVQDVFLRLIEKPEMFDTDQKFSTWIYVVTANRCRQHLRDNSNRLRIMREEFGEEPEAYVHNVFASDKAIVRDKVHEVYASLSVKEKGIYNLRFVDEKTIREISEILQIPEGSVKSGIYYLLKKFAYHLKDI